MSDASPNVCGGWYINRLPFGALVVVVDLAVSLCAYLRTAVSGVTLPLTLPAWAEWPLSRFAAEETRSIATHR